MSRMMMTELRVGGGRCAKWRKMLALAFGALLLSSMVTAPARAGVQHGGLTVSEHRLQTGGHPAVPDDIAQTTVEQLKIVEAAALPPDVLEFFRSVQISFDPDLKGQAGVFSVEGGQGEVRIKVERLDPARPIILHELLHAFHFHKLGLGNPSVLGAFRRARAEGGADARRAYFLSNPKEFFAVTASIYLVGEIQQAPFTCDALKDNPGYLAFLRSHLGPGQCNN